MSQRALTFCKWPGCNELVRGGYCDKHKLSVEESEQLKNYQYNKSRGSSTKQGYGSDWQRVRKIYLRKHPLCEECIKNDKIVPAVLVHHIIPIQDGGDRLDENNLKALCDKCHENIHGKDRWRKKKCLG